MANKIKEQWVNALEEILQCPVCLLVPECMVFQCTNGHHVCQVCKNQLLDCPLCKASFTATRNLVASEISSKFEGMKASMLNSIDLPAVSVSRSTQTNAFEHASSKYTQTKMMSANGEINAVNLKPHQQPNIVTTIAKGKYPCRIGSCTIELPNMMIIEHLKRYHRDVFYHFNKTNQGMFSWKCLIDYSVPKDHDVALKIENMGTFFLNITIHGKGELMGTVQIINSASLSKQFLYKLEIGNWQSSVSYSGMVKSCRTSREILSEDCLYIRDYTMRKLKSTKDTFYCSITLKTLTYVNDGEEH